MIRSEAQRKAMFAHMQGKRTSSVTPLKVRRAAIGAGLIAGVGTAIALTPFRFAAKPLFNAAARAEAKNPVSRMQVVHQARRLYPELRNRAIRFLRTDPSMPLGSGFSLRTSPFKFMQKGADTIENLLGRIKDPYKRVETLNAFTNFRHQAKRAILGVFETITGTSNLGKNAFKARTKFLVGIPKGAPGRLGQTNTAGVLAHELGHTTKRFGPRSYITTVLRQRFSPTQIAEEMRANVKGYKIYRAAGGSRKAFGYQTAANQASYLSAGARQLGVLTGIGAYHVSKKRQLARRRRKIS